MPTSRVSLPDVVKGILRTYPRRTFSKEEILNLLASEHDETQVEHYLAELEVASIGNSSKSEIRAKCTGGTVYYEWTDGS